MATTGASATITLSAHVDKYLADMRRASAGTEAELKNIKQSTSQVAGAMKSMATVAVAAFVAKEIIDWGRATIDAADHMNDMAQRVGIAVQQLGKYELAANQSGTSVEALAKGIKGLAVNLSEHGKELRAAGITATTADEALVQLADVFANMPDGMEKTTLAVKLFGKSGMDLIPMLNGGSAGLKDAADKSVKYAEALAVMAPQADAFNDSMAELALASKTSSMVLLNDMMPALTSIAKAMADASIQGGFLKGVMAGIDEFGNRAFDWSGNQSRKQIATLKNDLAGLKRDAADLTAYGMGDSVQAKILAKTAELDAATQAYYKINKSGNAGRGTANPAAVKPEVNWKSDYAAILKAVGGGQQANADDPAKNLFTGNLKTIDAAMAQERAAIEFGNRVIQELRAQDIVSMDAYNAYRKTAIDNALQATLQGYDKEIAAAQAYQAQASKMTDKADAQNKIDELRAKKSKAIDDANAQGIMLTLELGRAQSDLNKTMADWNRMQSLAADQMAFNNGLISKSALEVEQLNAQRRIELDIEEKIRAAQERGAITQESIDKFHADGKAQQAAVNRESTLGAGIQIGRSFMKPQDAEAEKHANTIRDLQAFKALQLENEAEGNRLIEEENQRHAAAMYEMRAGYQMQTLDAMGGFFGDMYSMLQQSGNDQTALGKAAFLANKAIAVAEIIMNTNLAASKAEGQLGIFGLPAASVILATGYARAGMVAGMAISGMREKGGAVWGGGAFVVGERGPEIFKPTGSGTIIPNHALGGGASNAPMAVTIVNQTSAPIGRVVEQRISPTERALIIQEAVNAQANALSDPNSRSSRAMGRNYSTQRSR